MPWARFTAEVGVFRRAEFRHAVKEVAHRARLDACEFDEERGWLISYFTVRLAGPTERLAAAKQSIRAMREMEESQ